jgi:hypothetical protein
MDCVIQNYQPFLGPNGSPCTVGAGAVVGAPQRYGYQSGGFSDIAGYLGFFQRMNQFLTILTLSYLLTIGACAKSRARELFSQRFGIHWIQLSP